MTIDMGGCDEMKKIVIDNEEVKETDCLGC